MTAIHWCRECDQSEVLAKFLRGNNGSINGKETQGTQRQSPGVAVSPQVNRQINAGFFGYSEADASIYWALGPLENQKEDSLPLPQGPTIPNPVSSSRPSRPSLFSPALSSRRRVIPPGFVTPSHPPPTD